MVVWVIDLFVEGDFVDLVIVLVEVGGNDGYCVFLIGG